MFWDHLCHLRGFVHCIFMSQIDFRSYFHKSDSDVIGNLEMENIIKDH